MATLPTIAPRRLYRQIADVIERFIDDGTFAPGTLLPAERELAKQLAVSRASVREALIALEVQGRVSVRVGNGVSVLARPARSKAAAKARAATDWPAVGPLEVVQARRIVECETAALAARRATPDDIDALERHLKALRVEHRGHRREHPADRAFHVRIAEISGNQALVQIVNTLWDQRASRLFEQFEQHFTTKMLREPASHDHRHILDAIRSGDARAARSAMKAHLDRVHREYSRAL